MRRVLRSLSVIVTLVTSLLAFSLGSAATAAAAAEGFSGLSPSSGVRGQTYTFTFTVTLSTAVGGPFGYYLRMPSFDYDGLTCTDNVTFQPVLDAGRSGACVSFDTDQGLHFHSPGLGVESTDYTITITGLKTPAEVGTYTLSLMNFDNSATLGTRTFSNGDPGVAPGGVSAPAPQVIIDIDGNGGACSAAKVTGPVTSWGTAPGADQCTRAGYTLGSFNTSADGSGLRIPVGGNLHLTGDNRLFAQWLVPPPIIAPATSPGEVVATARLRDVRVNWTSSVDAGGAPISHYRVTATPGNATCVTNATDRKPTQCTLHRLTPGTAYTFTVAALGQGGWSPESVPSNAATPTNPHER